MSVRLDFSSFFCFYCFVKTVSSRLSSFDYYKSLSIKTSLLFFKSFSHAATVSNYVSSLVTEVMRWWIWSLNSFGGKQVQSFNILGHPVVCSASSSITCGSKVLNWRFLSWREVCKSYFRRLHFSNLFTLKVSNIHNLFIWKGNLVRIQNKFDIFLLRTPLNFSILIASNLIEKWSWFVFV